MLKKEQVKTIADLVHEAGQVHGNRVFVRYEKEDRIKEMSFGNFYELCKAVAGWTEEKNRENGYNVRIHHIFCIHGDFLLTLKDGNVICLNQDMMKLGAHMQLFQPTTMATVPMMAKSLYNKIAIIKKQYPDKSLEEIKTLVFGKRISKIACGGGYLAPDLAAHYWEMGIAIGQGYGMTECSPKISAADFSRPDKAASVGKIVGGCEVRIQDGEI